MYTNINPIIESRRPMISRGSVLPFHAGLFLKALHLYDALLIPIRRNPLNKTIILNKNKLFFKIIPPDNLINIA